MSMWFRPLRVGAPHWVCMPGVPSRLTRGSNRSHIIRASLESIAYQTKDVLDAMIQDTGAAITSLRADGGASANNFLMQFQSDIIGCPVTRPRSAESTALGARLSGRPGCGILERPG